MQDFKMITLIVYFKMHLTMVIKIKILKKQNNKLMCKILKKCNSPK